MCIRVFGAADVVPFVPLGSATMDDAIEARDRFAAWAAAELGLPCFLYGPERTLPEVRRAARDAFVPDVGPAQPHPTAGAVAVGARPVLVAYNVWLAEADLDGSAAGSRKAARPVGAHLALRRRRPRPGVGEPRLAAHVRSRSRLSTRSPTAGRRRADSSGLLPRSVLERIPPSRWAELDLGEERHDRGPPRTRRPESRRLSRGTVGEPAAAVRRWRRPRRGGPPPGARRMRRRSRSLMPPQMPNFSPCTSAYSRQSSRTTQPLQTSFASRVDAPRSGKNRSGSTPRQLALSCQPFASVSSTMCRTCGLFPARSFFPVGPFGHGRQDGVWAVDTASTKRRIPQMKLHQCDLGRLHAVCARGNLEWTVPHDLTLETRCEADITTLDVDAIVNAANASLLGGGGVDGAIHRAAGPELLEECRDARRMPRPATPRPRGLPPTGPTWVIHTVGPVWRGGGHGEPDAAGVLLPPDASRSPTSSAPTSIAFPAISTGVYGFPKDAAAEIAVATIRRARTAVERVVLVVFADDDLRRYERLLADG